ncbi:MAG: PEP-CTERM sorting domain-containing protein [Sorangiineae bacterium PRO1]|nr:PEP-CTERM sorting domain-containing protein [Sorangiineae bacterium PRO1]
MDDFFELYRRAGGKGGGGFCAIGADPSPASLALAGLALGAWLVRRRRRQG